MTDNDLKSAPRHVQLAVDLIMLLEQHQIPPREALDALAIVTEDYQRKLAAQDRNTTNKER